MIEMVVCARQECGAEYQKKTHNQKYCSSECCRIATNLKIMQRYYTNKSIKSGSVRVCAGKGCSQKLSRYNMTCYCAACSSKTRADLVSMVKKQLGGVSI